MTAMRCAAMALVLFLGMLALPAQAALAPVPALSARVTDTTQTLDEATRSQLTQQLADLEQRKGAQIAVLMVPTTGDESIEQYALRAFEQWKLGRKNVDDGILFVVAKNDRKLRIEVGYGLGGAVTDLLAGRIIREQVAPRFKQGDFAGGVAAGVDSLVKLVDGEDLPPVQQRAEQDSDNESAFMLVPLAVMAFLMPPFFALFAVGFFVGIMFGSPVIGILAGMAALLISLFGRNLGAGGKGGLARASRRGGVAGGLGGLGGGFGGGGFGGGGFGGGGGGGFGGGGGGSGGGGASGGW